MLISQLFNLNSFSPAKGLGEVWKPKSGSHMVGRDVNALTQTSPVVSANRDLITGNTDDVRFTSNEVFSAARDAARNASRLKNFRAVDVTDLKNGAVADNAAPSIFRSKDQGRESVSYKDGILTVTSKDERGLPSVVFSGAVTEDTRIAWGKDGSIRVLTGAQALSKHGTLKAEGAEEVLIRVSGRNVEAGADTIVLNLSDKKGVFSGGENVAYFGSYGADSIIKGGKGETEYAGYFNGAQIGEAEGKGLFSGVFEQLTIDAADAGNRFTGYFSGATVNGGNGKNVFKGMFLNHSVLHGGDGDDDFSGRFIDASLWGGKGNDKFGLGGKLENAPLLADGNGTYNALVTDFLDSVIDAGEGDDSLNGYVWGGSVDLGQGNDSARGMFAHTTVKGGEGDDNLAAVYSDSSMFEAGQGNDSVALATAMVSRVDTGEGDNLVSLGFNPGVSTAWTGADFGGDATIMHATFSTPEQYDSGQAGIRFGELQSNTVLADQGNNVVHVNNGSGVKTVLTGEKNEAEQAAPGAATAAADAQEKSLEAATSGVGQAFIPEVGPESGPEQDRGAAAEKAGDHEAPTTLAEALQQGLAELAAQQAKADAPPAEPAAPNHGLYERRTTARALERYMQVMGDDPQRRGGLGASIITGAGETVKAYTEYRPRHGIETDRGILRSFRHRFNGYANQAVSMKSTAANG